MAGDLVLPDKDPAVLDYRARAETFHREALALKVDSDESQIGATALLATAAGVTKAAEAKRTEIVKVHNDFVKRVNEFFRQVLRPIVEGDSALREKVLTYVREKNRKAAEAVATAERQRLESEALLREAEKAEADGKPDVAEGLLMGAVTQEVESAASRVDAVAVPKTLQTPMGSTTVKKVWTFKLLDLEKVPHAYVALDETAVREAIRQGVREIPGLEIFQDETLSVRR